MSETTKTMVPLVVDLDGTLIFTDLLYEGILLLIRRNPLYIFSCMIWVLKGKVFFKRQIFARVELKYDLLPYNGELLKYLISELGNGRQLVLATASPLECAKKISKLHSIFGLLIGTENLNLKGNNKLKVLIKDFGKSNFDYIGNSNSDFIIFKSARFSYLVNPSRVLERQVREIGNLKYVWIASRLNLFDYLKAIRAYQWIKNILIFVPVITSHLLFNSSVIIQATVGFFAFNLTASAGYIINDLLDLDSDRSHPRKKFRTFASGRLTIPKGIALAIGLFFLGILMASKINTHFILILLGYFLTSFTYSFYFKKIILIDVFILAFLYSTRIIAGGIATKIPISFWLITFSTFIFLSLAFVKRCSELMRIEDGQDLINRGREYGKIDLNLLQMMGVASGFISVVVFSLYINSSEVLHLYSNPKILWTISFAFLFWISHIWITTNRGEMTDDPIVYALKDKLSYLIMVIIGTIIFFSV